MIVPMLQRKDQFAAILRSRFCTNDGDKSKGKQSRARPTSGF